MDLVSPTAKLGSKHKLLAALHCLQAPELQFDSTWQFPKREFVFMPWKAVSFEELCDGGCWVSSAEGPWSSFFWALEYHTLILFSKRNHYEIKVYTFSPLVT